MALRNVAKTFSLEQQRVEINELAADVDALNLNSTTLSSFSVTTNIAGISALTYDNATGIFSYTPPDLSGYLTTSSPAGGITSANITNWDTAYNWGDHANAGYLTDISSLSVNGLSDVTVSGPVTGQLLRYNSTLAQWENWFPNYLDNTYVESDPVFTASVASGITNADVANWNAAYGWGDHGLQGYLTSVALDDISDVTITTPSSGEYLSYDGTGWINSAIPSAASIGDNPPSSPNPGDLWWESDSGRLKVYYQDVDTSQWVDASPPLANPFNVTAADAANWDEAYGWGDHAQAGYITAEADTLATVTTRGNSTTTGITLSTSNLILDSASDQRIQHNVSGTEKSKIIFRSSGAVDYYASNGMSFYATNAASPINRRLTLLPAGGVQVEYQNSVKLETTATGVTITGDLSIPSKLIHDGDIDTYLLFDTDVIKLTTAGSERITIGSSGQLGLGGSNYGASGEVLTSNGPTAAPSWQAPTGGGGGSGTLSVTTSNAGKAYVDAVPGTFTAYGVNLNDVEQNTPTYTNTDGTTTVPVTNPANHPDPVSLAFDGREDTYVDVTSTVDGGVVEIVFTNSIAASNLSRLILGFDGNIECGFNGGNYVTASGATGSITELTVTSTGSQTLDKLSFRTPTASSGVGNLYYVIASYPNGWVGGTNSRLTIKQTDISVGSSGTGDNQLIMHDSSPVIQLTPSDVNKVVAVKTDISREIILPAGTLMTPGDTVTVIDVGYGALDRDDTNNYPQATGAGFPYMTYNSGNAQYAPIKIYPSRDEGIQGTNIQPWNQPNSISNYTQSQTNTGYYVPEPFHGMPFAIKRNGGSIKLMWIGPAYGWRILP